MYSINIEYINSRGIYQSSRGDYKGNALYPLAELINEVVGATWYKDFEEFLLDASQKNYGSNETHAEKKGNRFVIYPFMGKKLILPIESFYDLYFKLKQAFNDKVPLITITCNGDEFSVDTHEKAE